MLLRLVRLQMDSGIGPARLFCVRYLHGCIKALKCMQKRSGNTAHKSCIWSKSPMLEGMVPFRFM